MDTYQTCNYCKGQIPNRIPILVTCYAPNVGELLLSIVPLCAMFLVFVLAGSNGKEDDEGDS